MFIIKNAVVNLDNGDSVGFDRFSIREEDGYSVYEGDTGKTDSIESFALRLRMFDDGLSVLYYNVSTKTSLNRFSYGLAKNNTVVVNIIPDEVPEKQLAIYNFSDWWTRPAFLDDARRIPERTVSLLTKNDDYYTYYLPLCGACSKAEIAGGSAEANSGTDDDAASGSIPEPDQSNNVLSFEVHTGVHGLNHAGDMIFAASCSKDINKAISDAFCTVAGIHPHHPKLREEKRYPELFEYLGWCSWDAFYTQVSEEGVLAKADEFIEKGIPVNWFIIDDGWLSTKDGELISFEEDKSKFPHGFSYLTRKLKTEKGIKYVGVWHAIAGYWGGVNTGSDLYDKQRCHLYNTVKGKALPHYEHDKGFGFWNDWYEYMRGAGVDFVKVDGQGALKNYYDGEKSVGQAAYGTHRGLEAAVCSYFDGRVINCMGMEPENIWSRTITAVSRNSDDFMPRHESGFAEHLLQNAYNSLYHGKLYYGDWDMYWTDHFDALRHALLRAISGGPVYFSDKVGCTDRDAIRPLVYLDGRILRCCECGIPSADCIFDDPAREGRLMKIVNRIGENGVMAMFSLTDRTAEGTVSPSDIYWLGEGEYIMFDYFARTVSGLRYTDRIPYSLNGYGAGFATFIRKKGYCTPIGLIDKYAGIHAVLRHDEFENSTYTLLRESSVYAFASERTPRKIWINGADVTNLLTAKDNYYVLDLNEEGTQTGILTEY